MLMVICGAGASYDSVPALPPAALGEKTREDFRPPLASELFERRHAFENALAEFPECRPIIPWLRNPQLKTLEGELQRLQDEAPSYPARYCQLAAVRYYLQQMLFSCEDGWRELSGGITNQRTLLDMIEQWRQAHNESVCFVTFNYDTLIEDALPDVGLRINSMNDYISGHPNYRLIKLHGSVTWSRDVVVPTNFRRENGADGIRHELIKRAAELQFSDRYFHEIPYTIGIYTDKAVIPTENRIAYPAIAIPVERKSQFECPREHVTALCSILPKIKKVLIVGWRAMEQHFLKLMQDHLVAPLEVMIVEATTKSAEDVKKQLEPIIESRVTNGIQSVVGGFTQFIENRNVIGFLEGQPDPTYRALKVD
jgi:hypothetical protein